MSAQLNTLLERIRHDLIIGEDSIDITSMLTNAFNASIRESLNKFDPEHCVRRTSIKVFSDVLEYAIPTDWKSLYNADKIKGRLFINQTTPRFLYKHLISGNQISERVDNWGTDSAVNRVILIEYDPGKGNNTLHNCDTIDGNGAWAADSGNDATNVVTDSVVFLLGSGSVKFDISVSQSANNFAQISNSSMTALDLTDYQNKSYAFLWVYIPTSTYITSITLYWGSSLLNYWSRAATAQFNGAAFKNGWNLIGVDWNGATQTGSPTVTSVNYAAMRISYSASQTNMTDIRIDDFVFRLWEEINVDYNSIFSVLDNDTTTRKQYLVDGDDVLMGDPAWEDVIYYKALVKAFADYKDTAGEDYSRALLKLNEAESSYNRLFPNARKAKGIYYARKGI